MEITWRDKIPDIDVLQLVEMTSLYTTNSNNQLQRSVHVVRMNDDWLPKRPFYGELATGKWSKGGQLKRYKNSLKVSLKNFGIDRGKWKSVAIEGTTLVEGNPHVMTISNSRSADGGRNRTVRLLQMKMALQDQQTLNLCATFAINNSRLE